MRPARLPVLLLAAALAALPALADTDLRGRTPGGAFFTIVVPDSWNGDLVIWNHGFDLSPIGPVGDLGPLVDVHLLQGYAVAASSYRQSGWALFKSHLDIRELVEVFNAEFGAPTRIFLYGASLGGIVTAAAIERISLGNVAGALTLCGAMAGSRNWDGALDLRLLYDAICGDVPGAAIPGGAKGLPKDSDFSAEDLEEAVNACTGISLKKRRRSREQKARLKKLTRLSGLPQEFLLVDMGYVTFALADLIHDRRKLRGRLGMGNAMVDYGDPEIDAAIERVEPKRKAERRLRRNYSPKGTVGEVKIVSMHTDKDGLVIVENQREYAEVVPPENLTVAIAVERTPSHCLFTPAEVLAGWEALVAWVDSGLQPSAADIQAACQDLIPLFGGLCRIDPDFEIPDMDGRIRPRDGA